MREPCCLRDVLPYYSILILMICSLIGYVYTRNMLLSAWVIYIGTPLYNLIVLDDDANISKKMEKAHFNSKQLLIPLCLTVFF